MESKQEPERWVMTLDAGLRLIGRVVAEKDGGGFILNPAFEYLTQIKFVQGQHPERSEAVCAVDMVGAVPVHVVPSVWLDLTDLPEWRQKEIGRLIAENIDNTRRFLARKSSGLIIP